MQMKSVDLRFLLLAVIIIFLVGCQTTGSTSSVSSAANEAPPLCEVVVEPTPILIGEYEGTLIHINRKGAQLMNPISYKLAKLPDNRGYSLYVTLHPERAPSLVGYQKGRINGNTMEFNTPKGRTIQFIAEGNKVYVVSPFSGDKFAMTRK